jgi:hypothetical protein
LRANGTRDPRTHQMWLIPKHFKHFAAAEARQFRSVKQGLVNHARQGLVNHAGRSSAGDALLTRLFKPERKPLG